MSKNNNGQSLALGISLGVALGTSLGIALDNLPIGIALGISIGSALGSTGVIGGKRNDEPKTDHDDKASEETNVNS